MLDAAADHSERVFAAHSDHASRPSARGITRGNACSGNAFSSAEKFQLVLGCRRREFAVIVCSCRPAKEWRCTTTGRENTRKRTARQLLERWIYASFCGRIHADLNVRERRLRDGRLFGADGMFAHGSLDDTGSQRSLVRGPCSDWRPKLGEWQCTGTVGGWYATVTASGGDSQIRASTGIRNRSRPDSRSSSNSTGWICASGETSFVCGSSFSTLSSWTGR